MKKIYLFFAISAVLLSSNLLSAQNDSLPFLTTLRMEVRADFEYHHLMTSSSTLPLTHDDNTYGFKGRYFNIHVGGNFTRNLSYYFRQRIVANPGSNSFFDNTDFLYLNYQINKNWSLRAGKEALAVGGFEYDAPPIDVLFWSYYWDNFYCFQLAAGAKFRSNDGKNTLIAQVGNSPYLHYGSPFKNSLLSYNLFWGGDFGPFHTLYSFNMFQRDKQGHFMNYIALGNKLAFNRWDIYVDFIHRTTSPKRIMKDFGVIACANFYITPYFNLFVKGAYEQNLDQVEYNNYLETGEIWDCLALPGQMYTYGGIGFEYRPKRCTDIRIHGFVADFITRNQQYETHNSAGTVYRADHNLTANVGLSWFIDIMKYINKKVK